MIKFRSKARAIEAVAKSPRNALPHPTCPQLCSTTEGCFLLKDPESSLSRKLSHFTTSESEKQVSGGVNSTRK